MLHSTTTSLLVVDAQCGFTELCPNELPVPDGAAIVPSLNRLLSLPFARIDATQDWHPPDHRSFLGRADDLFPPHCVAGTPGADFLPGLRTERFHSIWRKGYNRNFEAYAVTAQHPGFAPFLRASGITSVVVCGIATNVCCYFAARDLLMAGFEIWMAEDACAGIDLPAADLYQEKAKAEGTQLGIHYTKVSDVERMLRERKS